MKKRISLTLDEDVYDTLKLQAIVMDIPVSRYINRILRQKLDIQNNEIQEALSRLERKSQIKD